MNSGERRLVGAALVLMLACLCLAFNINAMRLEGVNIFNLVGITFSGGAYVIAIAGAIAGVLRR